MGCCSSTHFNGEVVNLQYIFSNACYRAFNDNNHYQSRSWWVDVPEDELPPEMRETFKASFGGEYGNCRQEIVFIGIELNKVALCAKLDVYLLGDDEMVQGAFQ